jgi:ADP-heptose:LPS heptosyltransferase/uncharacterized protein YnzC (UPF0291/DUF896 family)
MKKILIVNLRRLGDVYSTGHLISSLSANVDCEISLLTYEESTKAATNLNHVKDIYTIDRQELITITTNKLFTDSMALDKLVGSLAPIKEQHWDMIINYSNDMVSSYLCSYLKSSTDNITGVHFDENRNVLTNNMWEIIFNDVITTTKLSPVHFVDCYHKMCGVSYEQNATRLSLNLTHNQTAQSNIEEIKKGHVNSNNTKTIAIQLTSSNSSKNISRETTVQYLKLLVESGDFIPMLLIAPNTEERTAAESINNEFNDELIVVESDLSALASVVANVDLLVTPDTVTKHIADLANSPVIEISLGESPFLKQGSYNPNGLILTDVIGERTFSKTSNEANAETNITAIDLFATTIFHFSTSKNIKPILSKNVTLYKTTRDDLGINFTPIAGTIDSKSEIQRLMSRQFISSLVDQVEISDIYNRVIELSSSAANEWCQNEKTIITETMKDILGTLRSLLQNIETKRSSREFIMNLGKLINHCEHESVTQIAVLIFKTKIESISAKTFEENAKAVEHLLYELKSNVQKNLNSIKTLEDKINETKKEDFMQRNNPQLG